MAPWEGRGAIQRRGAFTFCLIDVSSWPRPWPWPSGPTGGVDLALGFRRCWRGGSQGCVLCAALLAAYDGRSQKGAAKRNVEEHLPEVEQGQTTFVVATATGQTSWSVVGFGLLRAAVVGAALAFSQSLREGFAGNVSQKAGSAGCPKHPCPPAHCPRGLAAPLSRLVYELMQFDFPGVVCPGKGMIELLLLAPPAQSALCRIHAS